MVRDIYIYIYVYVYIYIYTYILHIICVFIIIHRVRVPSFASEAMVITMAVASLMGSAGIRKGTNGVSLCSLLLLLLLS